MVADGKIYSWVKICRSPACIRKLETDDQYEIVTPFLRLFRIRKTHRPNIFLIMPSLLFHQDIIWAGAKASVIQTKAIGSDSDRVSDVAMALGDGRLALSNFSRCRTELKNVGCTFSESFADPLRATQTVLDTANSPALLDRSTLEKLEAFMFFKFSVEE